MKIAVLGASSFSGAAFVRHAAAAGHEVLPLSRPKHDLRRRDLSVVVDAARAFGARHFVNFAALNMVAESWVHFEDYYETNVIGVTRLAQQFADADFLEKFVQVSTPEVYGTTEAFLKESTWFRPSTPYAVSRAAADMHLAALHRVRGFPVCFTRSVNVYGPGQQPYRIIPKTVLKIARGELLKLHGGGVSTRSFIHINDVAEAILRVAADGRPGEAYHVAHADQVSIRMLVGLICHEMGTEPDAVIEDDAERPGKDMAYQLNDDKIRDELGHVDRTPLSVGLPQTVAWFRERASEFWDRSLEYEHRNTKP